MKSHEFIREACVGNASPIPGRSRKNQKTAAQRNVEQIVAEGPGWDKAKKSLTATGAGILGASALIGGIGAYNDASRAEKVDADKQSSISQRADAKQKMQAELQAELQAITKKNSNWVNSTFTDQIDGSVTKFKTLSNGAATLKIQFNSNGTQDSIIEIPGQIIKSVSRCKIDNKLEVCGGHVGGEIRKIMPLSFDQQNHILKGLHPNFYPLKKRLK